MRRENQIGRHQMRVLMMLVALEPRPVDARWLAYIADPGGDQSRGNRVLATLEQRGLIVRDSVSRSVDRTAVLKWKVTPAGALAWADALPGFIDEMFATREG